MKYSQRYPKSRRTAKVNPDHFLSAPGIYELEPRISEWNRGTLARNKIRRSESRRLQTSHDVGGRAHGTYTEPAQPSPDAGGRGPRSQSDGGGRPAPPRLLLFPSPPSRPRPQTQTLRVLVRVICLWSFGREMLLLAAAGLVAFVLLLYMVSPLISPKPLALPGAHVVVSGLLLLLLGAAWRTWASEATVLGRGSRVGWLTCRRHPGTALPFLASGTRPRRRQAPPWAAEQCHGEGARRVPRALGLCAARSSAELFGSSVVSMSQSTERLRNFAKDTAVGGWQDEGANPSGSSHFQGVLRSPQQGRVQASGTGPGS